MQPFLYILNRFSDLAGSYLLGYHGGLPFPEVWGLVEPCLQPFCF
jgi:hypothetical protein